MKNNLWKESILILATLVPVLYLLINWDMLPNQLPVHFNMAGEVDGYGSRYIFIVLPVALYFLMLLLPYIDPRKKNYKLFDDTYYKLRFALSIFIASLNISIIYSALNQITTSNDMVPLMVFALIAIFGNYMGNIRPNYFVGIKVPWTLNNDEVWRRTHKKARGIMGSGGGLAGSLLQVSFTKVNEYPVPWVFLITIKICFPNRLFPMVVFSTKYTEIKGFPLEKGF